MPDDKAIAAALGKFAGAVTAKYKALAAGEPEEQFGGEVDREVGEAAGR